MISDNLPITEIMMLLSQAVVKGLKGGIANQFDFNGCKIGELTI